MVCVMMCDQSHPDTPPSREACCLLPVAVIKPPSRLIRAAATAVSHTRQKAPSSRTQAMRRMAVGFILYKLTPNPYLHSIPQARLPEDAKARSSWAYPLLRMGCAAAAIVAAQTATYPIDTIRRRLQVWGIHVCVGCHILRLGLHEACCSIRGGKVVQSQNDRQSGIPRCHCCCCYHPPSRYPSPEWPMALQMSHNG